MSRVVLLDAGPLGLLSHPKLSPESSACATWAEGLLSQGVRVFLPEIADYEVRRELLRADKQRGLERLNELSSFFEYLPLTTATMRQAAVYWATTRRSGRPMAAEKALDGDVILAAQAASLGLDRTIVATTNVAHLSRLVAADLWQNISA